MPKHRKKAVMEGENQTVATGEQ